MATQISALQPKVVIPFASMAYFSNVENSYLNDHVNSPKEAHDCIARAGKQAVVLYPGDSWQPGAVHDNKPALDRYAAIYGNRDALPLRQPGASVQIDTLREQFAKYSSRLFKRNSRLIMTILRYIPKLGAFHPVSIRLTDLNTNVSLSVIDGFRVIPSENCDVSMHSSSLSFIFMNEFGYDTLTVNGRFEATPKGFSRMTRSLAVGSLNAMGLSVSLTLLLRPKVVLILLGKLATVIRQLMPTTAGNKRS
jgi:UDP-MurNAc hydroxylase